MLGDLSDALKVPVEDLHGYTIDTDFSSLGRRSWLHVCSTSWPMGYSWSSFIGQATSVSVVAEAGVLEEHILSDQHRPPANSGEYGLVQTDDIIFYHSDLEKARLRLERLEQVMAKHHIPQKFFQTIRHEKVLTGVGLPWRP